MQRPLVRSAAGAALVAMAACSRGAAEHAPVDAGAQPAAQEPASVSAEAAAPLRAMAPPRVPPDVKLPYATQLGPLEGGTDVVVVNKVSVRATAIGPALMDLPLEDARGGLDAKYKRNGRDDRFLFPLANAVTHDAPSAVLFLDLSTPMRVVDEVLATLREVGTKHVCLAVRDEHGPGCLKLADPDPCLAAQRSSPEQRAYEEATKRWAMHRFAPIDGGRGDAAAPTPPPRCDGTQSVDVEVQEGGYAVGIADSLAAPRSVAPGCGGFGPGVAAPRAIEPTDFEALRRCVAKVATWAPKRPTSYAIGGAAGVELQTVVSAIDALERPGDGGARGAIAPPVLAPDRGASQASSR